MLHLEVAKPYIVLGNNLFVFVCLWCTAKPVKCFNHGQEKEKFLGTQRWEGYINFLEKQIMYLIDLTSGTAINVGQVLAITATSQTL